MGVRMGAFLKSRLPAALRDQGLANGKTARKRQGAPGIREFGKQRLREMNEGGRRAWKGKTRQPGAREEGGAALRAAGDLTRRGATGCSALRAAGTALRLRQPRTRQLRPQQRARARAASPTLGGPPRGHPALHRAPRGAAGLPPKTAPHARRPLLRAGH